MDHPHEPWLGETSDAAADLFRAMADPVRRRILEHLVGAPHAAGELARLLGMPRVNVSHHLGVLADAGLVDLRQRRAIVKPQALTRLRRYFDLALTSAAIHGPGVTAPVADVTQP